MRTVNGMLSCKETSRLISESSDRKLGLGERLGIRLHLWMCENCRRFERQMQFLRKVVRIGGKTGKLPVTASLPEAARERILKTLRERAGSSDE
jgi:hypothetical protein